MSFKISNEGLDLIKSFEGLKLKAYKPLISEKYYTIGYGHYGKDVKKGSVITEERALELLRNDVSVFEDCVNKCVGKYLQTNNQFDACVSLCYNIGCGRFAESSIVKNLENENYLAAADSFLLYIKAGGNILNGLVKRREKEKFHFLK